MAAQVDTRPAIHSTEDFTHGHEQASKDVSWYQRDLNKIPKAAVDLFRDYADIPEDRQKDHIYRIRDVAWDILPYPCVGLFRFIDCAAALSPVYPEVVERVKAGQTFLDLGCCFGQDMRKLIYDGCPSENIIGVDSEPRFRELGYELFSDRTTLKSPFEIGDVFDPNFLGHYDGKIDIIFIGSFLHLFSFEEQVTILKHLVKLFRKGGKPLMFGRHLALDSGGMLKENALGWSLFHHSPDTIEALFNKDPNGDKWDVHSSLVPYQSESWDNGKKYWEDKDAVKQMYFTAKRK